MVSKKSVFFCLFFCLINFNNCESTSPYLNENLINLYSENNRFNLLLPKLNELYGLNHNHLYLPWMNTNASYWVKLANQAKFLEHENLKYKEIFTIKLDLAKKLPYLKKQTNICLLNPWSSPEACSLKKLTKNIEFLCLIDNSNPKFVSDQIFFKAFKSSLMYSKILSDYRVFCWLIYAINYLEQCQLTLMINEVQCSLANIMLTVNLVLIKLNSTKKIDKIYINDFKIIYNYYSNLFRERSMQVIMEILILLNNQNILNTNLNEEKIFITKLHFDRLLSYLLNNYVKSRLNELRKYFLFDELKQNEKITYILNEKLRYLNDISVKLILSRVNNLST